MFKPNQSPTRKEREKQVLAEKLSALNPPKPPSGKPFYDDFDSYARDYPVGERFRAWVTNGGRATTVALFLGTRVDDNALPGHYRWASLTEWPAEERAEAEKLLVDMRQLAPFSMRDAITMFQLERE